MSKIYVAGHRGMVGSAIVRRLQSQGGVELITANHAELDLTNQAAVQAFFDEQRIDQVYLAAAKVGGIHANNTYPAEFIYDNLMMQANVIDAAHRAGVQKLLFLGSSCIYPKLALQPMREDACSLGCWSRPMSPMPSPRLRASNCARVTTASMGATTAA
jgi:GDP-L-fucose synthase